MKNTYDKEAAVLLVRTHYELKRKELCIVHIGGYDGSWGEYIMSLMYPLRTRLYECEPHPANHIKLFELLGDDCRVTIDARAINIFNGQCKMYADASVVSQSATTDANEIDTDANCFDVKCVSFPTLFNEYKLDQIDLLRVNAEGAEYSALVYNSDLSFLQRVTTLQVCLHVHHSGYVGIGPNRLRNAFVKRVEDTGLKLVCGHDFEDVRKKVNVHTWQLYTRLET